MPNLSPSTSLDQLRQTSRRVVRELGLLSDRNPCAGTTYPQGHALLELERHELLSVNEVAAVLSLDKSSASRILDQLRSHAWISLEVNPHDRRRKVAKLTAKGKQRVKRIHQAAKPVVNEALAHLSPSEVQTVVRGMTLYARALSAARLDREVSIRSISPDDNQPLSKIIRAAASEHGVSGPGGSAVDPELADLHAAYSRPRHGYWVARTQNEVVGGAGFAPLKGGTKKVAELQKVYVVPAKRGTGLGQKLVEQIFASARKRGYTQLYIETAFSMSRARSLYERMGCVPIKNRMGDTGHDQCQAQYLKAL